MSERKGTKKKGIVYYDGECPMCQAFVAGAKKGHDEDTLTFSNFHEGSLPSGLSLDSLNKEIHYVDANGEVFRNVQAIAKILEAQGISHVLLILLKIPGVSSLAVLIYRFIAANRYEIFGPKAKLFWSKVVAIIFILVALIAYFLAAIV